MIKSDLAGGEVKVFTGSRFELEVPYATEFETLFGDGVTFDNVVAAIAEFERTLISNGAAFDAFAEGEIDALTPQQRRGLEIFGSALMRCGECHIGPAFTDHSFRVVGVPDNSSDDKGRGNIILGLDYAEENRTLPYIGHVQPTDS